MRIPSLQSLIIIPLFALTTMATSAAADAPTIVMPDAIKWMAGTADMAGAKMAVLAGDPTASTGSFTVRVQCPDGYTFKPHMHPTTENVTVLSGTLMVGLGDKMDKAGMTAIPAGGFVSVPAGLHHYATAKGDTVIQISGASPFGMTPVP